MSYLGPVSFSRMDRYCLWRRTEVSLATTAVLQRPYGMAIDAHRKPLCGRSENHRVCCIAAIKNSYDPLLFFDQPACPWLFDFCDNRQAFRNTRL